MIYIVTNQKGLWPYSAISVNRAKYLLEGLKGKPIAADCETEGFDPYTNNLLLFQLGNSEIQIIIDCTSVNITQFKEFLETETLVFHNASFDLRFLYHRKIYPTKVFDTYLAEANIYLGDKLHPKSLAACAERYLGVRLKKENRGLIHRRGVNDKEVIDYAAEDVMYSLQIMTAQHKLMEEKGISLAVDLDNKFVLFKAYIEYCGFFLNRDKWMYKVEADEENLIKAKTALDSLLLEGPYRDKYIEPQLDLFNTADKCSVNWSSSQQVIRVLKDYGINTFSDKENRHSVDKKNIGKFRKDFPIVSLYLDYKEAEKIVSTYGREFLKAINPQTKRIHTTFHQVLSTGRMSSGGTDGPVARRDKSVNLQNIDAHPRTRNCFEGQGNNVLIISDFTAQEGVTLANLSKDEALVSFFLGPEGDLHSWVATKMFPEISHLEPSEVKKKRPDLRQIAKSAGFAIAYGGNGMTIARNLQVSIEQGNKVEEAYFKAFLGLKNYFKKQHKDALTKGYIPLSNVSGRKHFIYDFDTYQELSKRITSEFWETYREEKAKNSDRFINELKPLVRRYFGIQQQIMRNAQNYPVQGTAAEITKFAGVKVMEELRKRNYLGKVLAVNIIHDEIILECSPSIQEEVRQLLEENMKAGSEPFCDIVPMGADAEINKFWPGKE